MEKPNKFKLTEKDKERPTDAEYSAMLEKTYAEWDKDKAIEDFLARAGMASAFFENCRKDKEKKLSEEELSNNQLQ